MEQGPKLDYTTISEHVGAASIVAMGESTHGTHEFFETKSEIFKILVTNYGFNALYLESVDDRCDDLNSYLQTGDGNLKELVGRLFYVYGTEEISDLFSWLKENYDEYPVSLIGIDERRYVGEYQDNYDLEKANLRDRRMARVVKRYIAANPLSKGLIWAHDAHIATYLNHPERQESRRIPMGEHLRNWFDNKYYSVAQLFGRGYFNAALIEESGKFDNTVIVSHYARNPSKYFWENYLSKKLSRPAFLEGPEFAGLIEKGDVHYQRGLGWGVKHSAMHDDGNVMYVDISKAYNALLFFPYATASHLLADEQT